MAFFPKKQKYIVLLKKHGILKRNKMHFNKYFIYNKGVLRMFMLLAGGLLIILFAVIVAVAASVVSAVAAETDSNED